jgi:hypothetical protein
VEAVMKMNWCLGKVVPLLLSRTFYLCLSPLLLAAATAQGTSSVNVNGIERSLAVDSFLSFQENTAHFLKRGRGRFQELNIPQSPSRFMIVSLCSLTVKVINFSLLLFGGGAGCMKDTMHVNILCRSQGDK